MANLFQKALSYIKKPSKIVLKLNEYKIGRIFSDKFFLKCAYRYRFNEKLNLDNPQTFNEKLQWLKLYDRKPEYTQMVDKYEAKKWIAERIGEEYIIPTLGVWDSFDEIDFDKLPNQFVLKTTHDSGGVVICRDKNNFDKKEAKKKLKKSLKRNYYWHGREWPYKNVKPRILAEVFIDSPEGSLVVYKNFCFGGEPKLFQVIQGDKTPNESIDYFDTDWNLLPIKQNFPNSKTHLPRPNILEEMLTLSKKLSKGYAFLRVDWYIVEGKLKFSEFTFYSDAGFAAFEPEEWDYTLGGWIDLSNINKNL